MITKSYSFIFKELAIFLYFFLVVFGNKIGPFDINFIASMMGIIIIVFIKRTLYFPNLFRKLFLIILLLFSISLISSFVNSDFDINAVFRYIRVGISFFSITIVLLSSTIKHTRLIAILISVIFIHSISSIIGSFNLDFQKNIALFTGYKRVYHYGRSVGLTIGFDIGGIISLIGLVLTSILIIITGKKMTIQLILFSISTFLTTRFNMILYLITLLILFFIFRKNNRRFESLIILALFSFISFLTIGIFSTTLLINRSSNIPEFIYTFDSYLSSIFRDSYARTDFIYVINRHYNFSYLNNWIIGDGYIPAVDSGYTITIYAVGMLGLLFSIFFYLIIIKNFSFRYFKDSFELRLISFAITYWAFVVLFMSAKNNYFFTRNISELGFIMIGIFANRYLKNKSSNNTIKDT